MWQISTTINERFLESQLKILSVKEIGITRADYDHFRALQNESNILTRLLKLPKVNNDCVLYVVRRIQ